MELSLDVLIAQQDIIVQHRQHLFQLHAQLAHTLMLVQLHVHFAQ